jgi:uncharacterized protein YdeI (BOF family)
MAGVLLFFSACPKVVTAAAAPAWRAHTAAQQSEKDTKILTGTIIKDGDAYVLSDSANKLSYKLDDPKQASAYEGKKVKVTGTVDVARNTIHVQTIQEIA